jgi:flagellar protein FlaG
METKAALTPPPISEPSAPASTAAAFTAPGHPAGGRDVSVPKESPATADGPQPGDLRLVIEEDPASGSYVYKTVDRRTGDVLQQFPREDVLRFKQAEHYDPGEVFDGLT